jgi:hypothetical protein
MAVSRRPPNASNCGAPAKLRESKLLLAVIISALNNPMRAINRPIPTLIADLSEAGIELIILLRRGEIATKRNRIPESRTIASACCQLYPIPKQTVKVKNAFKPQV